MKNSPGNRSAHTHAIEVHRREYRPLTVGGAARIAAAFDLDDRQQTQMYRRIVSLTATYEHLMSLPFPDSSRDAVNELGGSIRKVIAIGTKYERSLDGVLGRILAQFFDQLLSAQGQTYLRESTLRRRTAETKAPNERSLASVRFPSEEGVSKLISLLTLLSSAIENFYRSTPKKGGRPRKKLYREIVLLELCSIYPTLFLRRPTSTPTGHFCNFARAVLEELECDTRGIEKASAAALQSLGLIRRRNQT